jgi:hypothetical protein
METVVCEDMALGRFDLRKLQNTDLAWRSRQMLSLAQVPFSGGER